MNPIIAAYFKEAIQRLGTRSPMFFRMLQFFMASLTFAGMIPTVLCDYFGIELQANFVKLCRDIAKVSLGMFLGGFFTVESKPVAIQENGTFLNQTDEKKLPYTKICENRVDPKKLAGVPLVAEVVAIKEEESSENNPPDEKKDDE